MKAIFFKGPADGHELSIQSPPPPRIDFPIPASLQPYDFLNPAEPDAPLKRAEYVLYDALEHAAVYWYVEPPTSFERAKVHQGPKIE